MTFYLKYNLQKRNCIERSRKIVKERKKRNCLNNESQQLILFSLTVIINFNDFLFLS